MYQSTYALNAMPFENTPDPRLFYASQAHREALAAIEYTIRLRKGIVLVTGDIGTGKTTVGRTMIRRCGDRASIAAIAPTGPHTTAEQVARQVLRALNITHSPDDDHARLLERLGDHLHDQAAQARPVVLFVDEAQALSAPALEELRLISNLDTDTAKLVQLVLVGQPELRQRIARPGLASLRQRIVMARVIEPLGQAETAAYVRHRIAAASEDPARPRLGFDDAALAKVHEHTGGVPRLINTLCDNSVLLAFTRQTANVDAAIVDRVQRDMLPSFTIESEDTASPEAAHADAGHFAQPRLSYTGGH